MMPVVASGTAAVRKGWPVAGSMKSCAAERRIRLIVAVQLGELDDLGLLGVDRQDDDLLLAVEGRAGLPVGGAGLAGAVASRAAAGAACPGPACPGGAA